MFSSTPFGSLDFKNSPNAPAVDETALVAFWTASVAGCFARLKNHNAASRSAASSTTGHSQRFVALVTVTAAGATAPVTPPSMELSPDGRKRWNPDASLLSEEVKLLAV